jgi:pimeloyl-ACP methyl ester carboxylesterase
MASPSEPRASEARSESSREASRGAPARALLAAGTTRRLRLDERGVEIAMLDFGGPGPLALAHHANGFCKGMWAEVAELLRGRVRLVAMDARGHGDSSRPEAAAAYAWHEFAADLAAVAGRLVAETGRPLALGLGHSFGGTSLLGAEAQARGRFERLLLIDPVTPPPRGLAPPERATHVESMVDAARRRRSDWPSREEARAWFAERSLFASWRPEALDLYVLDGLRERAGGGVELKCPGAVEAAVFSQGDALDLPGWVRGLAPPTLWLWAERGNFPLAYYEALAASMRAARVERVPAGHLIPMERPDLVADAALRLLAEPV